MKKYLLSIILLVTLAVSYAQQLPVHNHFFLNPFLYNPALAGAERITTVYVSQKKQWAGIEGAPSTFTSTLTVPFDGRYAFGAVLSKDKRGILNTISVVPSLSYTAPLGDRHYLRFGLGLGLGRNSLDLDKIDPQQRADDPAIMFAMDNNFFIDGRFGVNYQKKDFNIGLTLPKLFDPRVASTKAFDVTVGGVNRYLLNVGYRFGSKAKSDFAFEPILLYHGGKGIPGQFEGVGIFHIRDFMWAGGSYRQNYGPSVFVGLRIMDFMKFSYSYELASQQVSGFTNGSHELLLGFNIGKKKKPVKLAKSGTIIPKNAQLATTKTKTTPESKEKSAGPPLAKAKETKPKETKPVEVKPKETKPKETKPVQEKPVLAKNEVKPKEEKPKEVKPKLEKPKEEKPKEEKPKEVKPKEEKPKEKPIEPKKEEPKKEEPKKEEPKKEERKPKEEKPKVEKPKEEKPKEEKPKEEKPKEEKPKEVKPEVKEEKKKEIEKPKEEKNLASNEVKKEEEKKPKKEPKPKKEKEPKEGKPKERAVPTTITILDDEDFGDEYIYRVRGKKEKRKIAGDAAATEGGEQVAQQRKQPRFNVISKDEVIVIVKKGDHQDELEFGHYVVVGAFRQQKNCDKYIEKLAQSDLQCQYGYNSETGLYYVYLFFTADDLDLARSEAVRYRRMDQFSDTWVLTVEM